MQFCELTAADLPDAVKLYLDYYNGCEDGGWTEATALRRIRQVVTRMDAYGLAAVEGDALVAFAMGYFEQYDDCFAYDLVEIVVAADRQNCGIGTALMCELEARVKEKGAMLVQLQAVNDEHHEYFYGKLGYKDAKNLILKTKIL